jgi:Subtilase family
MPFADRAPIERQPEPFDPNNLRRSVIAVPLRELKELLDGIERQSIDALLPELGNRASLASLRGRVISLLLAMDASSDPLTDGGKPAPPAIDHIWPTRFEVIIDINLNFNPPEGTTRAERDELEQPDARHIARKWIAKYVEEAKKKAQIDDPDQGIDKEKTRLSAQYVFARLEGKVIQVLVAIDQRAAQRLAKEEAKAAARRVKETLRGAGQSGVPEPRRDPAITPAEAKRRAAVKSTHRDMPYMYGVSYFSSKGPTGDGRCKPDLLAPGEKIVSCAAPKCKLVKDEADSKECNYFETSGTSMAEPHVSGAIAAFLSIRKEFIGEPERVKKIFTSTATDLGRDRYFQGSGLVDLMRAIQSV